MAPGGDRGTLMRQNSTVVTGNGCSNKKTSRRHVSSASNSRSWSESSAGLRKRLHASNVRLSKGKSRKSLKLLRQRSRPKSKLMLQSAERISRQGSRQHRLLFLGGTSRSSKIRQALAIAGHACMSVLAVTACLIFPTSINAHGCVDWMHQDSSKHRVIAITAL